MRRPFLGTIRGRPTSIAQSVAHQLAIFVAFLLLLLNNRRGCTCNGCTRKLESSNGCTPQLKSNGYTRKMESGALLRIKVV